MSEQADAMLVTQCLEGNTRAFESIVDKYHKIIFNVALRMVNDHKDAEDITQSVFVKAYENLRSYNPSHKFFSWIYRMAINETLNFTKQKKRLEELNPSIISRDKSPSEKYDEIELRDNIQKVLMDLEIDYRVVILLKHFEEFSYKEIGYILDIPEKTVKSRLFTARQLLRDLVVKKGLVANG
jgi:RNA polymerase sigma-70 factor (ECF subfamily)